MFRPLSSLCMLLVFLGSFFRVRRGSWLGVWLGIEINLFRFLVLIRSNRISLIAQRRVKYFVAQRIGSIGLLFGFLSIIFDVGVLSLVRIVIGVFIKAGFFPFHSWVVDVVTGSRWLRGCIILTWQKFAPLRIFSFISNSYLLFILSLVCIVLIGSVGGLNQHSSRRMAVYSSFVHNSWMLVSLLSRFSIFFIYFFVYRLGVHIFFFVCWFLRKTKMINYLWSWFGFLRLLLLSGLPPFIGFFVKLIVFLSSPFFILIWCLLGSVVRLKFYISFFYRMLLSSCYECYGRVKWIIRVEIIIIINFVVSVWLFSVIVL